MINYAIFRLPHKDHCTLLQSSMQPIRIESIAGLSGREGFVFAPFEQSKDCPIILLKPDHTTELEIPEAVAFVRNREKQDEVSSGKSRYAVDFANFHSQLVKGEFSKIVLSRKETVAQKHDRMNLSPGDLFMKACRMYPRMMVVLVSTELTGTWLMATPEILLDGKEGIWHTMALAGTMKVEADKLGEKNDDWLKNVTWSQKNIEEQRYVASYITECLEQFADDFEESGPYTARAGNLVHLRSDFTFKMKSDDHIGDVLNILFPTPAVCGIPKDKAKKFIIGNESSERRYYSGFCGTLYPKGNTHLYVSLRCMEIKSDSYDLYAGGGLLKDSTEQSEWEETCEKMKTMRDLLD